MFSRDTRRCRDAEVTLHNLSVIDNVGKADGVRADDIMQAQQSSNIDDSCMKGSGRGD